MISDTLNLDKPLFLLSIVIASDVGGYIVGKLIGNIKIAPNISPNKTIEEYFRIYFVYFNNLDYIFQDLHLIL